MLSVLAGLTLAGVASELAARWWVRNRTHYYVLPPGLRVKLFLDTQILPQLQPTARFEVNSEGERGEEVPKASRGLYRVLVAGGSQPEGYFLDQDVTWPGLLQRMLRRPRHLSMLGASQVHVGCIARSGVGAEALNLVLEKTLPRYPHLELIVVMVGASDVLQWFEQNTPMQPQAVRVSDVFRCHPEGPFGWQPKQLALGELLRRARRRFLRPIDVHDRAGRWIGRARSMRARATTIRDTIPDPAPMLMHFEAHFRQLLQRARAHADRVLVVRQPWFRGPFSAQEAECMWHGGVGQAWREDVTTYFSLEASSHAMAMLDQRVAEVAGSMGVETLDVMPTLEQSLGTYYDGFHATPKGATQIALAVTGAILGRPHRASVRPALAQLTTYTPPSSGAEADARLARQGTQVHS